MFSRLAAGVPVMSNHAEQRFIVPEFRERQHYRIVRKLRNDVSTGNEIRLDESRGIEGADGGIKVCFGV
ncbi:hypothetical protein BELL_1007g00030 [Botrytis elliptica]|uniref:Uncharacterized protein n=1 Tax=Botrytis elliptica TaxID=278938 RepID=A0A4Z1J9D3_9HELO|nr:hypothetical protein BELL_1007g00030 [Botrytis elliptica]